MKVKRLSQPLLGLDDLQKLASFLAQEQGKKFDTVLTMGSQFLKNWRDRDPSNTISLVKIIRNQKADPKELFQYRKGSNHMVAPLSYLATGDCNIRMSLAQEVHDAGQEVAAANPVDLANLLNSSIQRFLGWPYKTISGCVVDRDGTRSEVFTSVVYAAPEGEVAPDPHAIPADSVAAVIHATENLDLDSFRVAYERIAQVKKLKKAPGPQLRGVPITTVKLGIIFAQRSVLPMEV